jgi:prolipoprotein diacylglyceryltransferase
VINQPLLLGTFSLYAIILTGTAALGLLLSWILDNDRRTLVIDAGLGLILFSLIGSRIGYLARNLEYFLDHPGEIPQFWLGGLTWPGALIGGLIALVGVHLIWKEPFGELLDTYLPLMGILSTSIWLTSWWAGTGYGPETGAWFGIPVQDLFGQPANRWPFPVLGALLSAGWIAGVIFFPLKRGRKPGFRGLAGLLGLMVVVTVFSFFTVDPAPVLWGLRRVSWIGIFFVVITASGIYLLEKKEENGRTET